VGIAVVELLRYKSEGRWFDPRWYHGIFHWHKTFWSHYGPGVDSASNKNEYQECFLGSKCGRCVSLTTLPPSCVVDKKSGNRNFLEHSGPPQDCNGTALAVAGQLWIFIANISYMLGITLFQALASLTPLFTLLYEVQLSHATAWPGSCLFTDTWVIRLLRNVCINKFHHTLNNCIKFIFYIFYSVVIALLLYLHKCVFVKCWLAIYKCMNRSLFDMVILVHGYEQDGI
jgi:hypothetical protein